MAAKKKNKAAKKKQRSTKVGKRSPGPDARPVKRTPKRRAKVAPAAPSRKEAPVRKKAERSALAEAPPPPVPKKAPKKPASPKPAAPAAAASSLVEGDRAPSFELQDQHGNSVSSSELSGHPYVLYFYPKDDTPGCTTQACGFRDAFPEFERASVRVLGVSPDSVASHQRFVGKYGLPFTLLSDVGQELASAYGVWSLKKNYGREYMGIVRSTFLIDGDGLVRKVWRGVRVNGHVSEVQAAAEKLA
jgi:peroxiredoxin Q/BCP